MQTCEALNIDLFRLVAPAVKCEKSLSTRRRIEKLRSSLLHTHSRNQAIKNTRSSQRNIGVNLVSSIMQLLATQQEARRYALIGHVSLSTYVTQCPCSQQSNSQINRGNTICCCLGAWCRYRSRCCVDGSFRRMGDIYRQGDYGLTRSSPK